MLTLQDASHTFCDNELSFVSNVDVVPVAARVFFLISKLSKSKMGENPPSIQMFNFAETEVNLTQTKFVLITFTNSLFPVSSALTLQNDKEVV